VTTTTRKPRAAKPSSETVDVRVVPPHLVFHNDEQRDGTLTGVPVDVAQYWARHGWVEVVADKPEPASDK
jgi:hypothetical protein